MRLLFENVAQKHFTEKRVQKFKDWIDSANQAKDAYSLDEKANQYDKAEELVTFYTFAPLELRENKKEAVQEILKLANIHEHVEELIDVSFEKQLETPKGYLGWLTREVGTHHVRYVREQRKEHVKRGRRLEANTHVDTVIETKNLLILIEVKFTSDISPQTTYNSIRNQLARTIDVGISEAEKRQKKLVVLLCSPSEFYHKKSRLYYYKLQEYSDFHRVREDICWRDLEEIKEHVLAIAWVPLEKVIEIIYRNFRSQDADGAKKFFKERNLACMHGIS
ncbi:MAG: hypothetical protein OEW62_10610 [Candidatus Bathyarchaeota archaeon]|nr:hypothetical protein [Candidatus Bathyarchaeota archaeon]